MRKKERIDVLLVEQGFFTSREQAKRSIMAGLVLVDNERIIKPGEKVWVDKPIRVKNQEIKYVSRGGYKLEKALDVFSIDLTDKVVLDIGSSTGGFTDCALQNGAKLVYALDVGTNQLDWKIRNHEQVVVMEQTNFRHATKDMFPDVPQFASIDVSFISLQLILPPLYPILATGGDVVALVKPQFEAGKERVGKKGIVRDKKVHEDVIEETIAFASSIGFQVSGLTFSPITGTSGNIEFLLHLHKTEQPILKSESINIKQVVKEAHELN